MTEDAWQRWSAEVNRRLARVERTIKPGGVLIRGIGDALGQVSAELRGNVNYINKHLGLPVVKAAKPRVRIPVGRRP